MKTTTTVLVSLLIAASSGLAQEGNPIAAGERIRVWTAGSSRPLIGIVQRADSRMLVLNAELVEGKGVATSIPVDSVTALQVSRGTRTKAAVGSTVGGLVGIVFGAVGGASGGESYLFDKDEAAIIGAVLFGAIGAGVGALIGLTIRSEDWKDVPVQSARIGLGPSADGGVSAGVVLGWR